MLPSLLHDGIATDEDVLGFHARLSNADKQLVKIGGLAHTAPLGINRHRFWHALHACLSMTDRAAVPRGAAGASPAKPVHSSS